MTIAARGCRDPASRDIVSCTGLDRRSFKTADGGPVQAVRGVDIAIAPGETVALLGPNGAGKSTTIDMMLGLLPPDAGHGRAVRHDPGRGDRGRRDRRDAAGRRR